MGFGTMHQAHAHGRGLHPLALLAVLALAYLAFAYVFTPNRPFPYTPDDFSFLAGSREDLSLHWKRPVSANIIFLVAGAGMVASYAVLAASTVLVAWLTFLLLSRVSGVRLGAVPVAAGAVLLFSHAGAFEHGKYLGLMTNLVSHGFGLASLLLLWHGWRHGRIAWCLAAVLAFLASAFAKEDFLLPPLLLLALLWTIDRHDGHAAGPRLPMAARLLLTALLAAVPVGAMAWNAYDRNPFVAGLFAPERSSPSYEVILAPASLRDALGTLFVGYTGVATLLAAIVIAVLLVSAPALRTRVAWLVASVVALALPYAVIPNNMPGYRAYAWLPWLAGTVAVGLSLWQTAWAGRAGAWRALPVAVAVLVGLVAAVAHQGPRRELAARYAEGEAVNRRMLETLEAHRAIVSTAPTVGLLGLEGPSPWCGNGTLYLRYKRGFAQQWIVFAPGPTPCYQTATPGGRRPRYELGLTVAPLAQACTLGAMPVLAFEPDGRGRLTSAAAICAGTPR